MPIQNLPAELQPAIQQGFLEREFHDGLHSILSYRTIADRGMFPNQVGETIGKTHPGLLAPVERPIHPAANTGLDNGIQVSKHTLEQYKPGINLYSGALDLNIVTSRVAIKYWFLQNAKALGIQAAQTLDRVARNALFNAYLGGHTWTAQESKPAEGKQAVWLPVDDIRGFEQVMVNAAQMKADDLESARPGGTLEPVSIQHPAVVYIGQEGGRHG